jgi:UDP-glucose 4-epimerase
VQNLGDKISSFLKEYDKPDAAKAEKDNAEYKGNLMITGGLGYIGSHTLVEILQTEDMAGFDKIVVVDNLSNSKKDIFMNLMQLSSVDIDWQDTVVFKKVDICNEAEADSMFD